MGRQKQKSKRPKKFKSKIIKYRFLNQPSKENAVGKCHYYKHKGYISLKVLRKRKCLEHGCKHFEKLEDNIYWQRKKAIKNEKKRKFHSERLQQN